MSTLIIPAAGLSTRFPNTRPKYMLTHPKSKSMAYWSVAGLDLSNVDKIIVTILKEHQDKYDVKDWLTEELKTLHPNVEIFILAERTASQVETVQVTLEANQIKGRFSVNDTDNSFKTKVPVGNYVTIVDLHEHIGKVAVANKSYVEADQYGNITNIVEKHILGSKFCCGLYSFASAEEFLKQVNNQKFEYLSQVIYDMIIGDSPLSPLFTFKINNATDYLDWGTLEDWNSYRSKFRTLFVDFDGVIVESCDKLARNASISFVPLRENIKILAERSKDGFHQIIITTARGFKDFQYIADFCAGHGIDVHQVINGLWHCNRSLINDFHNSQAPHPTCSAINLIRNSEDLKEIL